MGGGDLNMKKSWHPALMKNQEQVWLREKDALEEKKKLAQLRKEKEEERQMQELQRMQEEQTGRKRQERLDWMYSTPASGSTANASDLEEYLLGKKRVDKMLIGDEHAKLGASHKDFIAVQNANTQRDILAKIREDPLLAIKQQEQAAYQALMNNPLRLKEMKEKSGVSKKEKKDKKRKRERERSRSRSPSRRHRSRSASPRSSRRDLDSSRGHARDRDLDSSRGHDRDRDSRARSRSRSPVRRRYDDRERSPRRTDDSRRRSRSPDQRTRRRSPSPLRRRSPPHERPLAPPPASVTHPARAAMLSGSQPRAGPSQADRDAERAARLVAMSSSAKEVAAEREVRVTSLIAREKEDAAREEAARVRTSKLGVGSFLDKERSRALMGSEGDLGERIRRNRSTLVGGGD